MVQTEDLKPGVILGAALRGEAALPRKAKKTATPTETPGERLARLRRERGLTQQELAELLGVSQPVVSDYERGELRLHGELILQLAEILDASADEILGLQPARLKSSVTHQRRPGDVQRPA